MATREELHAALVDAHEDLKAAQQRFNDARAALEQHDHEARYADHCHATVWDGWHPRERDGGLWEVFCFQTERVEKWDPAFFDPSTGVIQRLHQAAFFDRTCGGCG